MYASKTTRSTDISHDTEREDDVIITTLSQATTCTPGMSLTCQLCYTYHRFLVASLSIWTWLTSLYSLS